MSPWMVALAGLSLSVALGAWLWGAVTWREVVVISLFWMSIAAVHSAEKGD